MIKIFNQNASLLLRVSLTGLISSLLAMENIQAAERCRPWTEKTSDQHPLFIARIDIVPGNIFDPDNPEQDGKIHQLMNKLHSVTKPDVIHRTLLFKVGDVYDPDKLAESERLLRAAAYLKEADIYPTRICGNQLDLVIRTRDNWTLTPGVSYGRSGGDNRSGVKVQEHNLFGWGKSLTFAYNRDHERDSFRFHYADKQLLNTRKQFAATLEDNSDGHTYRFDLESPFYAIDTPEGWAVSLEDSASETSFYQQGEVAKSFYQTQQLAEASYARANKIVDNVSTRYRIGWHHEQKKIKPIEKQQTQQAVTNKDNVDLTLSYPWVGYEYVEDSFIELENLNTMGRTEDTAIGKRFSIQAGLLTTATGNDSNQLKLSTTFSDSIINTNKQLGLVDFASNTYVGEGEISGTDIALTTRYHYFLSPKNTLFLQSTLKAADNLLPNEQYRLGGLKDMHGYPTGTQTGNKSAVFTAEYRHYFDKSPYQLFKLGAVAFADIGTAWGNGNEMNWIKDVGIGLRLVPIRSSSAKVIHIDLAYPLDARADADDMQFTVSTQTSF